MMTYNAISALIAMGAPPAPSGQGGPNFLVQMFPLILMVVVFYFILIRPQQKKAKEHAQMVQALKSGDKVLTNGGILGTVITVKEKTITLRSADTKLEILKSAVAEVTERGSGEAKE